MELSDALMQHMDWKVRLRTALAYNKTVDVESASDHQNCALGAWLEGEAKQRFGHLDSYRDCYDRHAHFHREAGKVVQCIGAGDADGAKAMLAMSGGFSVASGALIDALKRLRKDTE